MNIDTTKKFSVVSKETQISVKNFQNKKEAKDYAKFLTEYHKQEFEVKELNW